MSQNFKPGDVVVLKSGGPKMTVTSVDNYLIYVSWFDEKNEAKHGSYPSESLKIS